MFLRSKVTIGGRIQSGAYYFASYISKGTGRKYYTILDDAGQPLCLPEKYFESTVSVN